MLYIVHVCLGISVVLDNVWVPNTYLANYLVLILLNIFRSSQHIWFKYPTPWKGSMRTLNPSPHCHQPTLYFHYPCLPVNMSFLQESMTRHQFVQLAHVQHSFSGLFHSGCPKLIFPSPTRGLTCPNPTFNFIFRVDTYQFSSLVQMGFSLLLFLSDAGLTDL